MSCYQCKGITKRGTRCSLSTCRWAPYCHLHTPCEVKRSPIHGRGLFARADIPKDTIIGDYTVGTKLIPDPDAMTDEWRHNAHHLLQVGRRLYDARDWRKSIAGIANQAPRGQVNQVMFTKTGKLKTKQRVPKGRELFVSYGRSYWRTLQQNNTSVKRQ